MAAAALKLMKPKLSKGVRKKLGVKGAGRPEGSKSKKAKIGKEDLYKKLSYSARISSESGIDLTQEKAAQVLNLGGARQLRLLLRQYGDKRKWRDLINYG
jgi:hypothetical protein